MKFNSKSTGTKTKTHVGSVGYTRTAELELAMIAMTSFVEKSYYEGKNVLLSRVIKLCKQVDKDFLGKLMVYARRECNMRSITHVLAGELARLHKGQRKYLEAVIQRPDDMMEVVSYYGVKYGKPIPNSIKKAIRNRLCDFNSYQLAKYKGSGKNVKMADLFNLVHPKPKDSEQEKLWSDLLKGKLKNVDTWEVAISTATSDEVRTKEWERLIMEDKIGYMALLRNLRNLKKYNVSAEVMQKACEIITDKDRIKKSKQLPFRFLSAYKALESHEEDGLKFEKDNDCDLKQAVEKAISLSVENIPLMAGKTMILSDNSGSMTGDSGGDSLASRFGKTTTSNIANLFAVLCWLRADNTMIGLFGDRLIMPSLDRTRGLFENFKIIDSAKDSCGQSTEEGIFVALDKLIRDRQMVDRIIIFSDCQIGEECKWYDRKGNRGNNFNALFQQYREINPSVKVCGVNLKSYEATVFKDGIIEIGGWSDKIFDLMKLAEEDKNALLNKIKSYEIQETRVYHGGNHQ